MAELDIKGFVTPEQTFEGLYKTGEILAAQKAAKAKADEAAKANKAALTALAEAKFNPKDYLSGTVADPNITKKLAEGIQQVNKFIAENKGATESHVQLFASPIISQIAQDSEKSKELKRQMEVGLEKIKGMKGIDADKFRESFQNRAWGIKDKQLPDNLNNVDITHNYIDDVLNNDDIYNAEAVRESIKNAKPIDYQYSQTTRNKAGVEKSTLYDAKSQPFYQPITDASGKPTGQFEPKSVPFTDNDQVVMHEWLGDAGEKTKAPIKLLDQNAFEQIFSPTNNPAAAAYLRNEVKKHTEGKAPLNSSQAEALSRAIAYDLVRDNMTEPASIKLKEEQKQPIVKNVTNVSVGGTGGVVRDIYTPAVGQYKALQDSKNKAAELLKQGKSVYEVANETGLQKDAVLASQQGRNVAMMPLNREDLDAEFTKSVVGIVKDLGLGYNVTEQNKTEKKNYDAATLSVKLNKQGNWEVYPNINKKIGDRLTTIDAATLGYKVQPNAKGKAILAVEEKKGKKDKTKLTISVYPSNIQYAIKSYATAKGLSEEQAISNLIAANKIKPVQ
jgi:hypothetical protein